MKTTQEQLNLLEETVKHYTDNPEFRCISEDKHLCYYHRPTNAVYYKGKGCAVGRLLSPELAKSIDLRYDGEDTSVENVWHEIPEDVQAYGKQFLSRLQNLHDNPSFWEGGKLTQLGERAVASLKTDVKASKYQPEEEEVEAIF